MCGRFSLTADLGELARRFEFDGNRLDLEPNYNVAPTQNVLTVIDVLGEGNAPQAGTGGPAPEEPQDTPLPSTGGYSPPVWATALVVGIGAALAAGGVGLMVHSRQLSRRRMDATS